MTLERDMKIAKRIKALRLLQEEIGYAYLIRDGASALKLKDPVYEDAEFEIFSLQNQLMSLDKKGRRR